jgi:UDP-N-acetylmuramate--alanine ligase
VYGDFSTASFSRTKDLADGFAKSLDLADEVILLPIYPARELPMEGVSSEMILGKMHDGLKQVMDKESLLKWIEQKYVPALNDEFGDVLITAGAGDIDALVEPIRKIIEQNS